MKKISDVLKKEWFPILLILLGFIMSIYLYPSLPDKIPTHWNIRGEVDGYGSKAFGAFGIPSICLGVYVLYVILPIIDPKKKNYESFKPTYKLFKYMIIVFFLSLHIVTLLNSTGVNVDMMAFTQITMSFLFILLGNAMGRVKHNYFMGIRTPWTLANEEIWKRTHRMAAPLWVAGGVLNLILFLLQAGAYSFVVIITVISIVPTIYSYVIYHKIINNK